MIKLYIYAAVFVLIIIACTPGENTSTPLSEPSEEALPEFVPVGSWATLEDLSERLMRASGDPSVAVVGDTAYYFGNLDDEVSISILTSMGSNSGLERLVIDSLGGDVGLGLDFGEWVESAGLDIEVPTVCFSSCANYIFPSADKKTLREGAVLGWHGSPFQHGLETKEDIAALIRPELEASFEALPDSQKALIDIEEEFESIVDMFYEEILVARDREQALYSRLDVSPDLPIFYEKCEDLEIDEYVGFTLSKQHMSSSLRLTNLDIPDGYPGDLLQDLLEVSASSLEGPLSIGLVNVDTCAVSQ